MNCDHYLISKPDGTKRCAICNQNYDKAGEPIDMTALPIRSGCAMPISATGAR